MAARTSTRTGSESGLARTFSAGPHGRSAAALDKTQAVIVKRARRLVPRAESLDRYLGWSAALDRGDTELLVIPPVVLVFCNLQIIQPPRLPKKSTDGSRFVTIRHSSQRRPQERRADGSDHSANTSRCTGMGYGNAQQRNRYAASTRARR